MKNFGQYGYDIKINAKLSKENRAIRKWKKKMKKKKIKREKKKKSSFNTNSE